MGRRMRQLFRTANFSCKATQLPANCWFSPSTPVTLLLQQRATRGDLDTGQSSPFNMSGRRDWRSEDDLDASFGELQLGEAPVPADECAAERLLRSGQPDQAFLAAKRALDELRPCDRAAACHQWSLMGSCLERLGPLTAAYSLLMKGAAMMDQADLKQRLMAQAVALLGKLSVHGIDGSIRPEDDNTPAPPPSAAPHSPSTCPDPQSTRPGGPRATANSAGTSPSNSSACGAATARQLPQVATVTATRILLLSDLHVDRPGGGNLAALRSISTTEFLQDVLLVPGDVGDTMAAVRVALELLRPRFKRVVYLPGNHDLWLRPGSRDVENFPDSFCKLWALMDLCRDLDVDTGPLVVTPSTTSTHSPVTGALAGCPGSHASPIAQSGRPGGERAWVVPLLSWYHYTFDEADPTPGRYRFDSFCKWPVRELDVWQVMLSLNNAVIKRVRAAMPSSSQPGTTLNQGSRQEAGTRQGVADLAHPDTAGLSAEQDTREGGELAGQCRGAADGLASSEGDAAPPTVITMSHFLPHPSLPFSPFQAELAKAVGCSELQSQLLQVGSSVHVYGHTHINADLDLPDTTASAPRRRYVQHALEACRGQATLLCLWDCGNQVARRLACYTGQPVL